MGEQIGRGLDKIARRRQVERRPPAPGAAARHRAEGQQRLALGSRRMRSAAAAPAARNARPACPARAARRIGLSRSRRRPAARPARARSPRAARRPGAGDRGVEAGDDGGFDAHGGRAAVHHQIDAAAQVGHDMRRRGRRDVAGAVGRGRHHRPAERGAGCRARPDGRAPGPRSLSRPAVARSAHRAARQPWAATSVSGPGQNACGQPLAPPRRRPRAVRRCGEIGDMGDQRIERRAALGGIEPRHRRAVGRVRAEPVDRLGGERHEPAGREAARGLRGAVGACGQQAGGWLGVHRGAGHSTDAGRGGRPAAGPRQGRDCARPARIWRQSGRRDDRRRMAARVLAAPGGPMYKTGLQSECSAAW